MIARVISDVALDRRFDYIVPPELAGRLRCGAAVRIPFGNSVREGYVLELAEKCDYPPEKLKPLLGLSADRAPVPEHLIALGEWMAEYYCCSREQAIRTLLPAAVRTGRVRPATTHVYSVADEAAARKFLEDNRDKKNASGRCSLLQILLADGASSREQLQGFAGFSASSLATLVKAKLVAVEEVTVRRDFRRFEVVPSSPLPPTPEQKLALDAFDAMLDSRKPPRVMLLHGATNSGKTEVYLQMIAKVIDRGQSAIVLVPEISLTPQTVRRFRARFGDRLSVLHSRLTDAERYEEWHKVNSGEVSIVVGARSALFAPFTNLGLIIVDEEHETSYKQSEAPRYIARDVAVMRGKLEAACVVLGSATPSAESLWNARAGRFKLIRMPHQVENRPAPRISVVDLRSFSSEPGKPGGGLFSPPLVEAVRRRVELDEQCILFLNRRGYSHVLCCDLCGYEARCPECSVNYTYSRRRGTLSCHLCGRVEPAPELCPSCGSPELRRFGAGTEKIEETAAKLFYPARVARMDSDTMRSAADYERTLESFRRGDIRILIGTQMIAKGLHFPNVTLVGVLNPDLGLALPDFRASERVFHLLWQVAGRAGRGDVPGEVIIQTMHPENEVIQFAAALDFDGFSAFDSGFREFLHYPPFGRLIALHFRGEDENAVLDYAEKIMAELKPYLNSTLRVTDPAPAPIERIKGKYRYLALIRGEALALVRQAVRVLALHRRPPKGVEFYVDVDPQSLL